MYIHYIHTLCPDVIQENIEKCKLRKSVPA